MLTKKAVLLSLSALLLTAIAYGAEKGPITEISETSPNVSLYAPIIIEAKAQGRFEDPYDPREVEFNAHFTGPDGKDIVAPGFYTGAGSVWEVRYAPLKTGRYSYHLELKAGGSSGSSEARSFEVTDDGKDGFLRRSANNSHYLVFDSGKPFFGLGHNVCWTQDNSVSGFNRYFAKLAENGCNMTRIWLNSEWTLKLEFDRLGKYDTGDSIILDRILEDAEKNGIYAILTFDSYSSLMDEKGSWNEQAWARNVYNRKNGGPCAKPWDFFTNPEAKRLYRNRLRYIIARWGYSANVLAFELWNEVDAPKEWTAEMIDYIKSINPHGQLVTTSLGYPWDNNFDESQIWSLSQPDIVQRHIYGEMDSDIIGYIISTNRALFAKYGKPMLVEEIGIDSGKDDAESDPKGTGVLMHNGIWAAALSGSFGGAMGWWWDTYLCRNDFYYNYSAILKFLKGVDWDSAKVAFAEASPLFNKIPEGAETAYSDVAIYGKELWGDTSYSDFTVERNGDVSGGALNHYLQGTTKKDLRLEPVIRVDYPADGKLVIHIGVVSQGGHLVVTIDGKEALSKEFPAGPGEGPWKSSYFRKDYNIYQCRYDTTEEVDIPKGSHTIKISNTGKDWIGIKRIVLSGYRSSDVADARVAGITVGGDTLIWIQNKSYNHKNMALTGKEPEPVKDAYFHLAGIEDGAYLVEWYDTFTGAVISSEKRDAAGGKLTLDVPGFSKDIACRIKKASR